MLKHILLFLTALMPIVAPVHGDIASVLRNASGRFISLRRLLRSKTLVLHDQNSVILEVRGKYKYYDPYAKPHDESLRFVGKSQLLQSVRSGLK